MPGAKASNVRIAGLSFGGIGRVVKPWKKPPEAARIATLVMSSNPISMEPTVIQASRNGVDSDSKAGDCKRMKDVRGRYLQMNHFSNRHHGFIVHRKQADILRLQLCVWDHD